MWAGGTFSPVVLLCRVSFWFWREIGFGLHTHVLRVQYSCGVVLVFWLRGEIVLLLHTYLVYTVVCLQNNLPENDVEPVPTKSELPPKQSAGK